MAHQHDLLVLNAGNGWELSIITSNNHPMINAAASMTCLCLAGNGWEWGNAMIITHSQKILAKHQ